MTEPLLDHSRGNTRILQDRGICVTQGMRSGTQGSSDGFPVSRIISRVPETSYRDISLHTGYSPVEAARM